MCFFDSAIAGNGRKSNSCRHVWRLKICPESLLAMIFEKVADPCEGFGDLVNGCGVGTADVIFAAFAESAAGDEGNVFFAQKVFGKFFVCVAARRDVWEDVESAFRFEA